MAAKTNKAGLPLHQKISSDEGAPVPGRAWVDCSEEPSPVQAGAAGVGELRLSEAAVLPTVESCRTDHIGLALVGAICADRSNLYYF